MTISIGDNLPDIDLMRISDGKLELVNLATLSQSRRIAIFGVPGAFTRTCSAAHVPSFIRTKDGFADQGISDIFCVSVNDPQVMQAWAVATGADKGGLIFLADPECKFTQAMGMRFDAPEAGLIARSLRYSMLAGDGVVQVVNMEQERGVCDLTAGETLLQQA